MSKKKVARFESEAEEIATLLDVLHETGQRLEELTSGEVDIATDPEGRMLLLRGTREQLEQDEAARQAAGRAKRSFRMRCRRARAGLPLSACSTLRPHRPAH